MEIEEKGTTREITFNDAFRSILDSQKSRVLINLAKENPLLEENDENWHLLLGMEEARKLDPPDIKKLKKIIKENFGHMTCEFALDRLSTELDFTKNRQIKDLIQEMSKKTQFFRRSNRDFSVYKALSYGYLEELMKSDHPHSAFYSLLKRLLHNEFQLLNPFSSNIEVSFMESLPNTKLYLESRLLKIANTMLKYRNKRNFRLEMMKLCQEKMTTDPLFQFFMLNLVKSLIYDYCLTEKKSGDQTERILKGNLDFKKDLELVAASLNLRLRVRGYLNKDETRKSMLFEPVKLTAGSEPADFTINFYVCSGVIHYCYAKEDESTVIKLKEQS